MTLHDMMSSSGEESGGKYSIKPNSMLGKAKLKALAKAREAKAPKRRQRLDYDAEGGDEDTESQPFRGLK